MPVKADGTFPVGGGIVGIPVALAGESLSDNTLRNGRGCWTSDGMLVLSL